MTRHPAQRQTTSDALTRQLITPSASIYRRQVFTKHHTLTIGGEQAIVNVAQINRPATITAIRTTSSVIMFVVAYTDILIGSDDRTDLGALQRDTRLSGNRTERTGFSAYNQANIHKLHHRITNVPSYLKVFHYEWNVVGVDFTTTILLEYA